MQFKVLTMSKKLMVRLSSFPYQHLVQMTHLSNPVIIENALEKSKFILITTKGGHCLLDILLLPS